jgi:DHA2 family multidrug resistance protein
VTPAGVRHRGLITAAIMLATVMQVLDTTIANVALPHMQGSLSATRDQISWVLTSYIIAAAVMTPPTGWLAQRFGRKRVFVWAVVGFVITSMLCGIATSLSEMVLYRVLQGIFGASLVPISQALLLDTYPRERHGAAMAIWGIGIMVGPILGPTLGGYLTEVYSWRFVFFINLPFGILALIGIIAFVPEAPTSRERRFDVFGFLTLSIALGALQLMLDRGELKDWFSSDEIVLTAALAALAFYLFVVHSCTTDRPFLDPLVFADRNFVVGLVMVFVLGIILLSTLALLPPFLQSLMGYPVLTAGVALAPRGAGTMIAMMIVGRLLGRVDPRPMMLFGLCVGALSAWQMTGFTAAVDIWTIIIAGFLQGFGLGFVFVPLSTLAFATLDPRLRTEAASLFSLVRNIGGSVGIAVVVGMLSEYEQINHARLVEQVTPFNPMFRAPWLPQDWSLADPAGLARLDEMITSQASMIAYLNDFRLIMVVTLAAIPLLLLLRAPPRLAGQGSGADD